jgi:hypothetical protein
MADLSLSDLAIDTLDRALRETDPISRMMLIEHALSLHRQALEARNGRPVVKADPDDAARPPR